MREHTSEFSLRILKAGADHRMVRFQRRRISRSDKGHIAETRHQYQQNRLDTLCHSRGTVLSVRALYKRIQS